MVKKIAILGLGYSLNEFDPKEFEYSIGVNDIWRYHKTNAVVVLNNAKEFTAERLKIINECTPEVFYSQIVAWDKRKDFQKIDILPGYPDRICSLDQPAFCKSFTSPFVAAQIAYKYYFAEEIHLFGVDLTNHQHVNGSLAVKSKLHFKNLKIVLEQKGCKMIIHGQGILKDI